MIGQNPKVEVAPFFVSGNRNKEISFEDRNRHGWANLVRKSGGRSDIELLDKMTDAFKPSYKKSLKPVKEKILSEGTRQKAK